MVSYSLGMKLEGKKPLDKSIIHLIEKGQKINPLILHLHVLKKIVNFASEPLIGHLRWVKKKLEMF